MLLFRDIDSGQSMRACSQTYTKIGHAKRIVVVHARRGCQADAERVDKLVKSHFEKLR